MKDPFPELEGHKTSSMFFFLFCSDITDDSFIGSIKDVALRGGSQKIKTGYNYKLGFKPSVRERPKYFFLLFFLPFFFFFFQDIKIAIVIFRKHTEFVFYDFSSYKLRCMNKIIARC